MLWEPLAFAAIAGVVPSLVARGPLAIAEFTWTAAVACLSVAAAWALSTRAPAAVPIARAAIVVAVARELQRLIWTALPSDAIPGTQGWIAAAVSVFGAALWLATMRVDRTRA